jgi:hypothetical protein
MLEIILVIVLSQRLGQRARERGLPGTWGVLFAGGWIAGELAGGIAGGITFGGDLFGAYMVALVGAIVGGAAAWSIVLNLPAPQAPAASSLGLVAAGPVPAMANPGPARTARRAGYCLDCGQNVWLTRTGSCPNGHGPQSLTKCYVVED